MQADITRKINYVNSDRLMVFKQSIITNREFRIDMEDTEIKEIKIGEHIINYIFNKGIYNAYWNDNEFSYIITAKISFEELLKAIESIIQK